MKTLLHLVLAVAALVAALPGHATMLLKDQPPPGQCVMYGQCGVSPLTSRPVPCVYNGPPKPLTSPGDREILQEICPDLAHDEATCCDSTQLNSLKMDMAVPTQVLRNCPACLHNFRNIYGYMMCSPNQSNFLRVQQTSSDHSQVLALQYNISNTFTSGMFDSCKNVRMPSLDDKALDVMCGHPAKNCTPRNWLQYLGDTGNGQTPYAINFNLLPDPAAPAMDAAVIPCNSTDKKMACSCMDCTPDICPVPMSPVLPCATPFNVDRLRRSVDHQGYEAISLVIQRKGPIVRHHQPPPSTTITNYTAVFNKTFLHQILNLTNDIKVMDVTMNDVTIKLDDVCLKDKSSEECVVPSPLEYFQNSHKNLDKIFMDQFGFFVMADYLDHMATCFHNPLSPDVTYGNVSCLAQYGGVVKAQDVLCGYTGDQYNTATSLMVTYMVKDPRVSKAGAVWRDGLVNLVNAWTHRHSDATITDYQPFKQ